MRDCVGDVAIQRRSVAAWEPAGLIAAADEISHLLRQGCSRAPAARQPDEEMGPPVIRPPGVDHGRAASDLAGVLWAFAGAHPGPIPGALVRVPSPTPNVRINAGHPALKLRHKPVWFGGWLSRGQMRSLNDAPL